MLTLSLTSEIEQYLIQQAQEHGLSTEATGEEGFGAGIWGAQSWGDDMGREAQLSVRSGDNVPSIPARRNDTCSRVRW